MTPTDMTNSDIHADIYDICDNLNILICVLSFAERG